MLLSWPCMCHAQGGDGGCGRQQASGVRPRVPPALPALVAGAAGHVSHVPRGHAAAAAAAGAGGGTGRCTGGRPAGGGGRPGRGRCALHTTRADDCLFAGYLALRHERDGVTGGRGAIRMASVRDAIMLHQMLAFCAGLTAAACFITWSSGGLRRWKVQSVGRHPVISC